MPIIKLNVTTVTNSMKTMIISVDYTACLFVSNKWITTSLAKYQMILCPDQTFYPLFGKATMNG